MSKFNLDCKVAATNAMQAAQTELRLFCHIMGIADNIYNHFIGDDPYGVVDFQDGLYDFSMTDIHVVVSEYEHWLELYGSNEALARAVRQWYYWSLDWHQKHAHMEWIDARKCAPVDGGGTFLGWFGGVYKVCRCIGEQMWECDGFLTGEDNWSSMTALPDEETHFLEDYMPLRKPDKSYCPNLRSWLSGCPVPGLREATERYKAEQEQKQAEALRKVLEAKKDVEDCAEEMKGGQE